jgi:hypothetical protein
MFLLRLEFPVGFVPLVAERFSPPGDRALGDDEARVLKSLRLTGSCTVGLLDVVKRPCRGVSSCRR